MSVIERVFALELRASRLETRLAALDSMYRVASFVALGALLLLGAFAWQRLRPAAPPDLRDVPPAIR